MGKIDYKKDYKELYLPKSEPAIIDVPQMNYIMLAGAGDPNNAPYQTAVATLYALCYAIKMKGKHFDGYQEFTVFPLEGFWWIDGGEFDFAKRDNWLWTSAIRQPDFVTQDIFDWAVELCAKSKPELDFTKVRLEPLAEGLCVQAMHTGPYADEPATVDAMREFMDKNGLVDEIYTTTRRHHEVYPSDPRKTAPEKMKTVIRHPVGRK